jgi:hypothetical protein
VKPVVKALADPHIALNRFRSPMHPNDRTVLERCIAQQQCKVQNLTSQLEEANVLLRRFGVFDTAPFIPPSVRDAASAQRHKVQQLTLQVEAANVHLWYLGAATLQAQA